MLPVQIVDRGRRTSCCAPRQAADRAVRWKLPLRDSCAKAARPSRPRPLPRFRRTAPAFGGSALSAGRFGRRKDRAALVRISFPTGPPAVPRRCRKAFLHNALRNSIRVRRRAWERRGLASALEGRLRDGGSVFGSMDGGDEGTDSAGSDFLRSDLSRFIAADRGGAGRARGACRRCVGSEAGRRSDSGLRAPGLGAPSPENACLLGNGRRSPHAAWASPA